MRLGVPAIGPKALVGPSAQAGRQVGVARQLGQLGSQVIDVTAAKPHPGLPVTDDVLQYGGSRDDGWNTVGARLERGQTVGLVPERGTHDCARGTNLRLHVVRLEPAG